MESARKIFQRKPLIGMIHLPALPGEPANTHSMARIRQYAVKQTDILAEAGFDGVLVENYGDLPFHPEAVQPHTIAAMAIIVAAIRSQFPELLVGVNVLRNAAAAALAIAHIADAHFIRVNVHTGVVLTDQGLLQGRAYETIRYREQLLSNVMIWADINVKHAAPLQQRPLPLLAAETMERGKADALILTGEQTGTAPDPSPFLMLKQQYPHFPLVLGSGATVELLPSFLPTIDACIVGTALKKDNRTAAPIDPDKARTFATTYRSLRQNS